MCSMPLKTFTYVKTASLRWSRKTKGRERLSVNMISLPLGDFKHLSHIGLDAKGHHSFGDLSAFQNHQDLLQSAPAKPPRLLPATGEVPRRALPPGHRKSHSLPLLDDLELDVRETILPPPPPPPPPPPIGRGDGRRRSQEEEGEEEGGLRLKSELTHDASHQDEEPTHNASRQDEEPTHNASHQDQEPTHNASRQDEEPTHNASHQDEEPTHDNASRLQDEEEPCCALSFDLGPSILDDVLQVMDRHQSHQ